MMSSRMHTRRIQVVGGSTYTVSLPKNWVLFNRLKKGDIVIIEELGDNTLLLRLPEPEPITLGRIKKAQLNLAQGEELGLERMLVALYSAGYDEIKITQSPIISERLRSKLRSALGKLSGMEVVEDAADYIVVQNILDESKLSISKTLDRMELLVRSMLRDLERYSKVEDKELLASIISRDDELDKFYFLLSRQLTLILLGRTSYARAGIEGSAHVLPLKTYGKALEESGDTLVSISRRLMERGGALTKDQLKLMSKAFSSAVKAFRYDDRKAVREVAAIYSSYFQETYTDPLNLLIGRFLALGITMIEAWVDKTALRV